MRALPVAFLLMVWLGGSGVTPTTVDDVGALGRGLINHMESIIGE